MNAREDMIEAAARALCESDGFDWPYCNGARAHRADASVVLDAVLPQITTVEQLEALPDNALLIDEAGTAWRWNSGQHGGYTWLMLAAGPLTVVWQPAQPEADR